MSLHIFIGLVFFASVAVGAFLLLRRHSHQSGSMQCDEPRRVLSDEDDVASAASPAVSWESRQQIAKAISEWLKVVHPEDDHWNLAFAHLRDALDRETDHHLDVALYLRTHSQHATDLYTRFMTEETRWAATR